MAIIKEVFTVEISFIRLEHTMICLAVTYVIKPGHEEEAIEFLRKLTPLTRAEPGNLYYLALLV